MDYLINRYVTSLPFCPIDLYSLSDGLLIAFDTLLTTTASLPTYLDQVAYGCLPHHSQLQWPLMALPHRHLDEAGSVMGSSEPHLMGQISGPSQKRACIGGGCVCSRHVLFGCLSRRGQTFKLYSYFQRTSDFQLQLKTKIRIEIKL